jgi:hypothetical protein
MLTSGVRLHENISLKLFARDALMPGTADLRILGGRRVRGEALTSAFFLAILSPLCRYQHHQRQGKTA